MRRIILPTFLLILSFPATMTADDPAGPSAEAIAARAFDVMAGDAWERARYIAFTFNVERDGKRIASFPQRLDRYSGDYRVSGRDREGRDFVVVMNTNTKAGKGWLAGTEVADAAKLLETGYGRFINDTYWLLVPLKLRDPGTTLTFSESKTGSCGQVDDIVKLSFADGIGLTPKDQYWLWVNRDTGLVDVWEMRLQGMKPEDPMRRFIFHDWERHGGLLLSTRRVEEGKTTVISLDDIEVRSDVPANAFMP